MIINFGSCEVYYNGTLLSNRTYGGVSLNFAIETRKPVKADYDSEELVIGGTGAINFYTWSSPVTITNSNLLLDYGEVILLNSNATIILYKCKMLLDGSMETGTLKQKPFKVKLIFTANNAGNVFKLQ